MKVLLTGAGLLGTAILSLRKEFPDYEIVLPDVYFDLTDKNKARILIDIYKPDIVIHNAAKVGGVKINSTKQATMFYDNLVMTANIIQACAGKVQKIICFGSSCAFDNRLKAIGHTTIHEGEPFKSNYGYGWAKRMTHIHLQAAQEEFSLKYSYIVFPALYGPNDNFNLDTGHVLPCLIHKSFLAWKNKEKLIVWGDGSQQRDLVFVTDAAKIILTSLTKDVAELMVATNQEYSIREMVGFIVASFAGDLNVEFDGNNSGQARRAPFDLSLLHKYFPNYQFTTLENGIRETVKWFRENYPNVRI